MNAFSNSQLKTITTTVHANRLGVSRYVRAWLISLPMDGLGVASTSAMMPLFQLIPRDILQLLERNGMNAGRYTYMKVRQRDRRKTRAISSICVSTLSKPASMFV